MLFKIFTIFFRLGFIAFGGGYSMISLVKKEVVDKYKIMSGERFVNIVSIAEGLPGAIALNVSIFIGYTVKGLAGAITAALGSVLPSLFMMLTILYAFSNINSIPIVGKAMSGIRPIIISLILFASITIAKHAYKNKYYVVFTIIGFSLAFFAGFIPLPFIIVAGLVSGVVINSIAFKMVH